MNQAVRIFDHECVGTQSAQTFFKVFPNKMLPASNSVFTKDEDENAHDKECTPVSPGDIKEMLRCINRVSEDSSVSANFSLMDLEKVTGVVTGEDNKLRKVFCHIVVNACRKYVKNPTCKKRPRAVTKIIPLHRDVSRVTISVSGEARKSIGEMIALVVPSLVFKNEPPRSFEIEKENTFRFNLSGLLRRNNDIQGDVFVRYNLGSEPEITMHLMVD